MKDVVYRLQRGGEIKRVCSNSKLRIDISLESAAASGLEVTAWKCGEGFGKRERMIVMHFRKVHAAAENFLVLSRFCGVHSRLRVS